jgi:hypothetical protein
VSKNSRAAKATPSPDKADKPVKRIVKKPTIYEKQKAIFREQEEAMSLAQEKSISDYCNRIDKILLKIKSETNVFKKQVETSTKPLALVVP